MSTSEMNPSRKHAYTDAGAAQLPEARKLPSDGIDPFQQRKVDWCALRIFDRPLTLRASLRYAPHLLAHGRPLSRNVSANA